MLIFYPNFDINFLADVMVRIWPNFSQNNFKPFWVCQQIIVYFYSNGKKFIISCNRVYSKNSTLLYSPNGVFLSILPLNKFLLEAVFFKVNVPSDFS